MRPQLQQLQQQQQSGACAHSCSLVVSAHARVHMHAQLLCRIYWTRLSLNLCTPPLLTPLQGRLPESPEACRASSSFAVCRPDETCDNSMLWCADDAA
jgi:hypothetical protein